MKKKVVVVIGASGFVGRHVVEALDSEYQVIKTSREMRKGFIKFDVLKDSFSRMFFALSINPEDVVIVLCNKFGPMEKYPLDEKFAKLCEVSTVQKIVEECKEIGINVVYLSTSYVFSGDQLGYKESSPTSPISLYGHLKLEAERLVLDADRHNLILRLDKVIGARRGEKHLFTEWYETALSGNEIKCIKDQNFSPTFVSDIALAVKLSIQHRLYGLYHCVNTEVWQRVELARYFVEFMGLSSKISEYSLEDLGLNEPRPMSSGLNSEKLIKATKLNFTKIIDVIEDFKYQNK